MVLATPARAAAFTRAPVVAPTLAREVGLTQVLAVVPIQDRAVVHTPALAVALTLGLAAGHIPARAAEPTPVLVVELTLAPEGLVTLALEVATLTNGTAHLPTASERGKRIVKFKTSGLPLPRLDTPRTILNYRKSKKTHKHLAFMHSVEKPSFEENRHQLRVSMLLGTQPLGWLILMLSFVAEHMAPPNTALQGTLRDKAAQRP